MREGWEYKKIKDIGSVIAGTTPDTNVAEYWNGTLCWISPAELDGSHYLYDSKKKITEAAVKAKSLKLLPEGTVILSSRAPIGKVVINKVPTYCNQGFKCVVCGSEIYNEFLYWWFWGKEDYLNSLGTGATFKEISKRVVEEIKIPVPSLSTQESIVSELDKINELISLKKEQLKDYDNLAQSIFYDMFGDPVTNEKGWDTNKLETLTKSEGGGTPSKSKPEYWNGNIIWVSSKDMKSTYISDSLIHITQEGVNNSPAHLLPIGTILIVNRSGILKHTLPIAITTKEVTINQDIKALVVNSSKTNNIYLLYCLKACSPFLLSKVKAVTVDSIDFAIFKKLPIPLPPLPLQQSFAKRIEAIEKQKQLISSEIKDLETLLASRMQYWFD